MDAQLGAPAPAAAPPPPAHTRSAAPPPPPLYVLHAPPFYPAPQTHAPLPQSPTPQPQVMYAPWGVAPAPPTAQLLTHAALNEQSHAAVPPSVMGTAQGVPSFSLGLHVPLATAARVLAFYVPLVLCLLAALGVLIGTFFVPVSHGRTTFTRSLQDTYNPRPYSDTHDSRVGYSPSARAPFAPCTVFKQVACDAITAAQVSGWMGTVTGAMQAPYPELLNISGIAAGTVQSCTYVPAAVPQPSSAAPHSGSAGAAHASALLLPAAHDGRDTPAPQHAGAGGHHRVSASAGVRAVRAVSAWEESLFSSPVYSSGDSFVSLSIRSSDPDGAQARVALQCDGDKRTAPMLNLTTVAAVNVSAYLSEEASPAGPPIVESAQVFADNSNSPYTEAPILGTYTNCSAFIPDCATASSFYYLLIAPASPLYPCGQGSIGSQAAAPNASQLYTVVVCETSFYETDSDFTGVQRFTVQAAFSMNVTLYPTEAQLQHSDRAASFALPTASTVAITGAAFLLTAAALVLVAAGHIPAHRQRLRRLADVLEKDAAVAVGILRRAQGAAMSPPVPLPATPAPLPFSVAPPPTVPASPTASAAPAAPPTQQPLMPPVVLTPPYYVPAGGPTAGAPGMMVLVGPPQPSAADRPPSPYGEGHYLVPPGEGADPAAAAEAAPHTPPRSPASPPRSERRKSGGGASVVADGDVELELGLEPRAAAPADGSAHELVVRRGSGDASVLSSPPRSASDADLAPDAAHEQPHAARRPPLPPPPMLSAAQQQLIHDNPALLSATDAGAWALPALGPQPALQQPQQPPHAHTAPLPHVPPPPAAPPLLPVSATTDWMFTRSRHVVSQDVLEESVAAASSAGERAARGPLWPVRWLRDQLLGRGGGGGDAAAASVRGNWPATSSSDDDDAMPGAGGYAGPESSPGERTIQLFVLRARKSYARLRRKQVCVVSAVLLYAKLAAFVGLVLVAVSTGMQLTSGALWARQKLQLSAGDAFSLRLGLYAAFLAMRMVCVTLVVACLVLSHFIDRERVW